MYHAYKVKDLGFLSLTSCDSDPQRVVWVHLRLPFLKEKTSDELSYAQDVVEFLSHMGKQIIRVIS